MSESRIETLPDDDTELLRAILKELKGIGRVMSLYAAIQTAHLPDGTAKLKVLVKSEVEK